MINRRGMLAGGAALAGAPALGSARGTAPRPGTLCNPRASAAARRLYAYLWSVYGRRTLTGQQESTWTEAGPRAELDYLQRTTGKLPAILGLDYIHPDDFAALADRATRWWREEGGIVTLCWHWGAPDKGTGYENSKKPFDIAAALRPGTAEHQAMWRDLDAVADQLAILRDRGVPVLWRPFHEFSGDWFWWGKYGPAAFKVLWRLMWRHYTRTRGLDNLLWVLGWAGQNVDARYWPGRDTVDVAGADIYVDDHGPLAPMFAEVKRIVGGQVPICLHENGPVPDPAGLGRGADWLWFMTWHTRWLTDERSNPPAFLREAFASERFVTKDELPKLAG
jgi:hypothetical protein